MSLCDDIASPRNLAQCSTEQLLNKYFLNKLRSQVRPNRALTTHLAVWGACAHTHVHAALRAVLRSPMASGSLGFQSTFLTENKS